MASTWSELGIRLMATGENSNAWGGQTNDNWNRIEDAADGFATVAVSGATSLTFTTQPTSYADENGRNKVLVFTGTAGSTQAITFPNIEKTYHVLNDSNSTLTLTTGTGAATVSLAAGKDMMIYNDGSDEIHNALANLAITTLTTSGAVAAQALTATTITASGIVKTDDGTDATSTTDGSLQTDGGLSVAKDAILGNDLKLLSDSAVLVFGAGSDATITHTNDTGLTLNSTNKLMFNDASQFIQGSSATVLSIGATDEIDLTATTVDLNGTLNVSGVATFQAAPVFAAGSIAVAALDIDGATDIGAAIVDADLFIIDDGAGGTNRKVTASRLKAYAGGTTDFTEAVTITLDDNTSQLTLISTDADATVGPNLRLKRDSSSPEDGDVIGRVIFSGENSASEEINYMTMQSLIVDVTDGTEDFQFEIDGMIAGTQRNFITMFGGAIIFNEDSQDIDFRVESDGNTHMLFVDAGNGRVGIGNSSPAQALDVTGNLVISGISRFGDGSAASPAYQFGADTNTGMFRSASDTLAFSTAGATKLTIAGTGKVDFVGNQNTNIFNITNSNGTPYGILIDYSDAAPDSGADNQFIDMTDSTTRRCSIFGDGDIKNHDGVYGQLSDERVKQDITDAGSQWNDIKALKVKKFKMKDNVRQHGADNAKVQIGLIAQDVEKVSPGLVDSIVPSHGDIASDSVFGTLYTSDDAETQDAVLYTSDDQEVIDGDKNVGDIKKPSTAQVGKVKEVKEQVKTLKNSILFMKAVKALQEAQTRIETLETKVAALEG